MPGDPIPPGPQYPLWTWVKLRFVGGLGDVADEIVDFLPLPKALKDPKLAMVKVGLGLAPSLFGRAPYYSQIQGIDPKTGEALDVLEEFFAMNYKGAIDKAFFMVLRGVMDNGDQTGIVSITLPMWERDP